jgi:tRNA-splicing ligase RtcB
MSKLKIQGKEIRALGYPEGPVISIAMNVMEKNLNIIQKKKYLRY